MKKPGLIIIALITTIILACGIYSKTPKSDANELWSYIQKTNYTSWKLFPGTTKLYKGQSPHGAFLTSYINDTGYNSLNKKTFKSGTIIVKENYTPSEKLAAITVMYKIDGYNPEGGDWFWVKYTPKGEVQVSGKIKGCITCHSDVKNYDWSFLKAQM
ncbi:hypothetical protein FHQ18_10105 [Deferribacter autotrophicus]|uniref:Cytochrome P460 domain-containing protein n=1 Tax=Deferribacter autotrophicus TaxID=500465 RepID=A0A5A8F368_9BACT|nr:cytochrome P460 family protein [Deferribacter autotrophicus]KAA0257391.1 hypothetical protein FHQ18_10105 [Deferribacter autotrophicus]